MKKHDKLKNIGSKKPVRAAIGITAAGFIGAVVMANSNLTNISFNPDKYAKTQGERENDLVFDGVAYSSGGGNEGESYSRSNDSPEDPAPENGETDTLTESEKDDSVLQSKNNAAHPASETEVRYGLVVEEGGSAENVDAVFGNGLGSGAMGGGPVIGSGSGISLTPGKGDGGQISAGDGEGLSTTEGDSSSNSTNAKDHSENKPDNNLTKPDDPVNPPVLEKYQEVTESPKNNNNNTKNPSSGGGSKTETNSNPSESDVQAPPDRPTMESGSDIGSIITGSDSDYNAGSGVPKRLEIIGSFKDLPKGASEELIFNEAFSRAIILKFEDGGYLIVKNAHKTASGFKISGLNTSAETEKASARVSFTYNSKTYTAEIPYSVVQWKIDIMAPNGTVSAKGLVPDENLNVNLGRYYSAYKKSFPDFCGWSTEDGGDIYTTSCTMNAPYMLLQPCTRLSELPEEGPDPSVLEIPKGFSMVDLSGFGKKEDYKTIRLSADVRSIDVSGVLENLPNLERFEVDKNNEAYYAVDGVLYHKNTLVCVPPKKTKFKSFAKDITEIGPRAMAGIRVEKITLPDTVRTIADEAFFNAEIKTLKITSEDYSVGSRAFYSSLDGGIQNIKSSALYVASADKSSLDFGSARPEIEIPDSKGDGVYQNYLAKWGEILESLYGEGSAEKILVTKTGAQKRNILDGGGVYSFFSSPKSYTLVRVLKSWTGTFTANEKTVKIAAGAFKDCSEITGLVLGEKITTLESGSLSGLSNLHTILISSSPPSVTEKLFDGISPEEFKIYVPYKYYRRYTSKWGRSLDKAFGKGAAKNIIEPNYDDCINIGGAWYIQDEDGLVLVRIPSDTEGDFCIADGTYKIEGDAFPQNLSLDFLEIPASVEKITAADSIADIGLVLLRSEKQLDLSIFKNSDVFVPASIYDAYAENCDNVYSWGEGCTIDENGVIYAGGELVRIPEDFSGTLTIPEGITAVHQGAGKNCFRIKAVVLSPDVSHIGSGAFENCIRLETVEVGSGKKLNISDRAFYGCVSLISPEVTLFAQKIGSEAFARCDALTRINLYSGLQSIGRRAFYGCNSLKSINDNEAADLSALSYLESCGEEAFACCPMITSVSFGQGLGRVSQGMFADCINLQTVKSWGSVKLIDKDGFKNTGFKEISLPDNTVEEVADGAFYGCRQLSFMYLNGKTVLKKDFIEDNAYITLGIYSNRVSFENLGEMLENNRIYAIYTDGSVNEEFLADCKSEKLRRCCGSLKADSGLYLINDSGKASLLKAGCKTDYFTMTTAMEVFEIAPDAFNNCHNMTGVVINCSISKIPDRLFSGCQSLAGFAFKNIIGQSSNIVEIGDYAFMNCPALENVELKLTVGKLGKGVFKNCTALKTVVMGNTSDISEELFYGCSALETVSITSNIQNTTKKIGARAFSGCTSLRDIAGLNSLSFKILEEIGDYAFENCTALKSVILPQTVVSLGEGCFSGSTAQVKVAENLERLGSYVFGKTEPYGCFIAEDEKAFTEKWGAQLAEEYGADTAKEMIKPAHSPSDETAETAAIDEIDGEEPNKPETPDAGKSEPAEEEPDAEKEPPSEGSDNNSSPGKKKMIGKENRFPDDNKIIQEKTVTIEESDVPI